jgi:serine/threonine protein kinase
MSRAALLPLRLSLMRVFPLGHIVLGSSITWLTDQPSTIAFFPVATFFHIDFVLDLVPNGELLDRIKKLGSLTSEGARYYTAQIVDVVGWMHSLGVIHRLVLAGKDTKNSSIDISI